MVEKSTGNVKWNRDDARMNGAPSLSLFKHRAGNQGGSMDEGGVEGEQ